MTGVSIIICSRALKISNVLYNNIEETIGVKYELIIIDNSQSKYSIFQAYNLGINKSKFEILCFIHDDILIHSNDWGVILMDIFEKNKDVGVIGVAGSRIKTKMPSAWWDCPEEMKVFNMIQHMRNGKIRKWVSEFNDKAFVEVAAIDGVFMAIKKSDHFIFDTSLSGFHNYDLNVSFEYFKKNKKIVVSSKLLVEHFSIGNINKSWYHSVVKVHSNYENLLPFLISRMEKKCLNALEVNNGIKIIYKLYELDCRGEAFKLWRNLFCLKPLSKFHFRFLKKIIL